MQIANSISCTKIATYNQYLHQNYVTPAAGSGGKPRLCHTDTKMFDIPHNLECFIKKLHHVNIKRDTTLLDDLPV